MLRWIFCALLLANLIGWYWFSAALEQRELLRESKSLERQFGDGVASLVLVSERGESVEETTEYEPVGDEVGSLLYGQPEEQGSAIEQEVFAEGENDSIDGVSQFEELAAEDKQVGEEVDNEGLPGAGEVLTDETTIEEAEVAVEFEGNEPEQCSEIGPFAEKATVNDIASKLLQFEVAADVVSREVVVREVYWLMIPPQLSADAAREVLRVLQSQKIDSFLIEDGDFINGISLGVFGSRDNAESYQARLVGRGHQPSISSVPRFAERYWLSMLKADLPRLSEGFWADIRQMSSDKEVAPQDSSCQ